MKGYNIIIVGAKDNRNYFENDGYDDDEYEINNINQASHYDLCKFKKDHERCKITCYDLMYKYGMIDKDGIYYTNDKFYLGNNNYLCEKSKNIIIDFCDLLDPDIGVHGVVYGYGRVRYEDTNFELYDGYDMVYLACGSSWYEGFPKTCLEYIMMNNNENIHTLFDNMKMETYIYTMNMIKSLYNQKKEKIMQPYIDGLKCVLGDFVKLKNEQENVFRELIMMIQHDIISLDVYDRKYLELFTVYKKYWMSIPLQIRYKIHNYIYNI
jgi:hypothetical protein